MSLFHKTHLGEHDLHRPACCEYCRMSSEFCPFLQVRRIMEVNGIVRWTDIADSKTKKIFDIIRDERKNYNPDESDEVRNERMAQRLSSISPKLVPYKADFKAKEEEERKRGKAKPDSNSEQIGAELSYTDFTCWGDGSGFEYDQMSRNVIGPGGPTESVYDLTGYGISHVPLMQCRWNSWIDKFQYDYRFGRVSDTNAECVLFPNVDNPWMFTEYAFKGVGGDRGKCSMGIPMEYVVEPPVYDEFSLELVNGELRLSEEASEFEGKYSKDEPYAKDRYRIDGVLRRSFRQYRAIANWSDIVHWDMSDIGGFSSVYGFMNSPLASSQDCSNVGIRLYCARIPVQSVKWGEHGNIPIHTLDMTAPKDWIEKSNDITHVKAVYRAVVGTKFKCSDEGAISWGNPKDKDGVDLPGQQGRQALVYPISKITFSESRQLNGKSYYTYDFKEGDGIELDMPQEYRNGMHKTMKPAEKLMDKGIENLCHHGCSLCKGEGSHLRCLYVESLSDSKRDEIDFMNGMFDPSKCTREGYGGGGMVCPHFMQGKKARTIATYQTSLDKSYLNRTVLNESLKLFPPFYVGNHFGSIYDNTYTDLGSQGERTIDYTVSYEVVQGSNEKPKLNKKKYNQFGKGVQIVPGTGKLAIDSEKDSNPFSGGDTNAYGDMNTLSFNKFFRPVMHCATSKYCNEYVGPGRAKGWAAGKPAGGDDDCRYYKGASNGHGIGCPYDGVPKRAIEFCHAANGIKEPLEAAAIGYSRLTDMGAWPFEAGKQVPSTAGQYRKVKAKSGVEWLLFEKWAVARDWLGKSADGKLAINDEVAVVAVNPNYPNDSGERFTSSVLSSSKYSGVALLCDPDNLPPGYLKIGKFRTSAHPIKVDAPGYEENLPEGEERPDRDTVIVVKGYFVLEKFYWYHPLTDSGMSLVKGDPKTTLPNMIQHVNEHGCWLCRTDNPTPMPKSNCMIIDNSEKFIGGWHPEYKDYSRIGPEFMQDIVSDASREGMGMGDYVQNGDYSPVPQQKSKKGYWIDQSGVYIMDERSTGVEDSGIASEGERESAGGGHGTCISFKKSNTEIDGETGKKKQPKTVNGAVYSNDPKCLVYDQYRKGERGEDGKPLKDEHGQPQGKRPMFDDPEKNRKYYAQCQINNPDMLPTMRHAVHCPRCDYYIPYKYHGAETCPWCGSKYEIITGSDGSEIWPGKFSAEGQQWPESSYGKVMRKFFKIYALGNAEVWAPPGTSVKTDAYFWRHQAQITNGLRKQIFNRIGIGHNFGGEFSSAPEMTLGYPEGFGNFRPVPDEDYVVKNGIQFVVPTVDNVITDQRYGRKYISWLPTSTPSLESSYNEIMPRHMVPGLYGNSDEGEEDEGIIAPYTAKPSDALKFASEKMFKLLRNQLEPMYAYIMDPYTSEYPSYRASYDQREKVDQPIIYQGRIATMKPEVMACVSPNNNLKKDAPDDSWGDALFPDYDYAESLSAANVYADSYQSYFSGDFVYGNVREYFPSGYTWWRMKNVIGGRYTAHLEGHYHMDDTGYGAGHMSGGSGGEYTTGDRTVAKCAIPLYGVLPLDKEIMAAYLLVSPSGIDPSKNPIGRSWTGGPAMYCHYHALHTEHFNLGNDRHLHGTAGYPPGQWFDENGEHHNDNPGVIYYGDESAYRFWGRDSARVCDDRGKYYDDNFFKGTDGISAMYDQAFYRNVGTPKKEIKSFEDENRTLGWGYDASSFPRPYGFMMKNVSTNDYKDDCRFQYLVMGDNGLLIHKYPDSVVWKTNTQEEIQKVIDRHTGEFELKASDGTLKNTVSYVFTQVDTALSGGMAPEQSQDVTGYFDMSWTNTRGYMYGEYQVDSKSQSSWSGPVIFQGDEPSRKAPSKKLDGSYGGGGEEGQSGMVTHVIPVTDMVSSLYNDRIDRTFTCRAGTTLDNIMRWEFYPTVIRGTLNRLDDDVELQNSQQCLDGTQGAAPYLLTEGNAYPELNGDISFIPSVSDDGDKYMLASKEATLLIRFKVPTIISHVNNAYKTRVGNNSPIESSLLAGSYSTYGEFEKIVKRMFLPASEITLEKVSESSILIRSRQSIEVMEVNGSCYPDPISIPEGLTEAMQNRIVSSTGGMVGQGPLNLLNQSSSVWRAHSYHPEVQTFTVDLLRAPLCKEQRDWRYEESHISYADAKCVDPNCEGHIMGCSEAAIAHGKFYDERSGKCPICSRALDSSDAETSPGDGIMTYHYDTEFSPDPIISEVIMKPPREKALKSSYRMYYKSTWDEGWNIAISMEYDYDKDQYVQRSPDKSVPVKTPPEEFSFLPGSIRARFVKVECDPNEIYSFHQYRIVSSTGYQAVIEGDFSDFGSFSLVSVKGAIGSWEVSPPSGETWEKDMAGDISNYSGPCPYGEKCVIISSQFIGEGNNLMRISLNQVPRLSGNGSSYVKFFCLEYYAGMDEFSVYGYHYRTKRSSNYEDEYSESGYSTGIRNGREMMKTGDMFLTITGPPDVYRTPLSWDVNSKYDMGERPTQIFVVAVGRDDNAEVPLSKVNSRELLMWLTEKRTVSEFHDGRITTHVVRQVKGGNYCYDAVTGNIYLPSVDQDGVRLIDFEKSENGTALSARYVPTTLFVIYWSGNGKSITLEARADGHGPSYQLEKNSIREIVDIGSMPDNGVTCEMLNTEGKVINGMKIPWICRNNIPARLPMDRQSRSMSDGQGNAVWNSGMFRNPRFTGKEIKDKMGDDLFFIQQFGDHCEKCFGQCMTEVTFTGRPNSILSGDIKVVAKAYTKTVIGGLEYTERTGGMNQGIIVCSCAPSSPGKAGKMTRCFSIPTLLVYAREKYPDDCYPDA